MNTESVPAPVRDAYLTACAAATDLLAAAEVAAAWQDPSPLPHYTVAGLAGHLAGQIFFAEQALAGDVPDTEPIGVLDYYDRVRWRHADHDEEVHVRIRRGGEATAAVGATALAARAAEAVHRLSGVLAAEPPHRLVKLPGWTWTLTFDDFLLSRTVELVVHADDLAAGLDLPAPALPPEVVEPVLDLLTRLSAERHGPTAVLRALTRAERAPMSITAF